MKLLVLGDLHLVSPRDPSLCHQKQRKHFVLGRSCLPAVATVIKQESPDFIISLGDLVDWYSVENRDFAIGFLNSLKIPWLMTPGNHDYYTPPEAPNYAGLPGWEDAGVVTGNRAIALDHLEGYLMNSHNSGVPDGTAEWLARSLRLDRTNVIFTHVPPDLPQVRAAIHGQQPDRNLTKYVQSHAADLFSEAITDRIDSVWSAHLHFRTVARIGRTAVQILPLSVLAYGRSYPQQGSLFFIDTRTMRYFHRRLQSTSFADCVFT